MFRRVFPANLGADPGLVVCSQKDRPMSLPPKAFYSFTEACARWGCAAADLAGWAATDHLTLVTSIAAVTCGKQPVAGIVAVPAADMGHFCLPLTIVMLSTELVRLFRSSHKRNCAPNAQTTLIPYFIRWWTFMHLVHVDTECINVYPALWTT